jgi:hypothetical protein
VAGEAELAALAETELVATARGAVLRRNPEMERVALQLLDHDARPRRPGAVKRH